MSAPVTYIPNWIAPEKQDDHFNRLWNELQWERRADAPRRECWMNDFMMPYTYGRGVGQRTYQAAPWHEIPLSLQCKLLRETAYTLEACFVNGYEGPRDHLGWHADDSPEIDPDRPIGVISLGSSREIWFRAKGSSEIEKLLLEPGSLLLMHPGMQQTHEHRIPKHPANCGPRVSLTYRGLVRASAEPDSDGCCGGGIGPVPYPGCEDCPRK